MTPEPVIGCESERRRRPRVRLACPLRIHLQGEPIWLKTKTEDLSCDGFFCISERSFPLHQVLECELVISGEERGTPKGCNLVLRCRAQVVRLVTNPREAAVGVAFRLVEYAINQQPVDGNRVFETLRQPLVLSQR